MIILYHLLCSIGTNSIRMKCWLSYYTSRPPGEVVGCWWYKYNTRESKISWCLATIGIFVTRCKKFPSPRELLLIIVWFEGLVLTDKFMGGVDFITLIIWHRLYTLKKSLWNQGVKLVKNIVGFWRPQERDKWLTCWILA